MADIWNDLTDAIGKEMAISEMNKKYLNTFLSLVNKDGHKTTVQYTGYIENNHTFIDTLGIKLKLNHETQQLIVCDFPERLLFNYNGVAFEFVRKPHRQYRRGICKDNVHISSPVRKLWNNEGFNWTIHTIDAALNPTYPPSCEHAVQLLDEKNTLSVALSPKFMLSQSITKEQAYYLFYCNIPIGLMKNGIFYIHHQLFNQEVLDNMHTFHPYKVEFIHAN
jgi:hypothetical protein